MYRANPDQPVRVAHVSSAHRTSDVRIHLREAASLAAAGYDVTVIAVKHEIPLPDTGVKVVSLRARRRLARVTMGSLAAIWTAIRIRAEVVHLHDPELIWAVLPLKFGGKVVIYDAHEDLPKQMLAKPYLPAGTKSAAAWLTSGLLKLASRSDHVVAATETIATRFPSATTTVVRNYPRLREADESNLAPSDRPPNVGYLGVMSSERGATQMVDAFASDYFPAGWGAVLAGPTSPASLLDELASRAGWRRVDYRGFLTTDGARDLLSACRVGIVVLQRTPAYLDSLPTKMYEYFAAGIPVIASDFPLWRSIVEPLDCGILVDETSPDAIAAAINRYASDPELLARHGANALRAAQNQLNWANEEQSLLRAYMRSRGR